MLSCRYVIDENYPNFVALLDITVADDILIANLSSIVVYFDVCVAVYGEIKTIELICITIGGGSRSKSR